MGKAFSLLFASSHDLVNVFFVVEIVAGTFIVSSLPSSFSLLLLKVDGHGGAFSTHPEEVVHVLSF